MMKRFSWLLVLVAQWGLSLWPAGLRRMRLACAWKLGKCTAGARRTTMENPIKEQR